MDFCYTKLFLFISLTFNIIKLTELLDNDNNPSIRAVTNRLDVTDEEYYIFVCISMSKNKKREAN